VELVIDGRPADVEGTPVTRVLPWRLRRMVGPWIFVDHFGPVPAVPGRGMDVRPHPHIGLATVTYLLQGEVVHRDSIGSVQTIRPGDLNWMTAGRGIVHSERVSPEVRRQGMAAHGLQLWVALPADQESSEPTFQHIPGDALPEFDAGATRIRLLAGSAYGRTSPVRTASSLLYAEARIPAGGVLEIPPEHAERAAYVVEGAISLGETSWQARRMAVFKPAIPVRLRSETGARVMLLGGAPLEGTRYIWWNFVSSNHERIEKAREDWKSRRFPAIPGDDVEFVPLPGS
jgi:redox-sensitive bicupin YhaK (pirin superfamily)